jgi:drug/metabolite transporter (DMT)-like permease
MSVQPTSDGMPAATRAILWMIAATMMFAATNTMVKFLSSEHDVIQITWARYTFHFVFIVLLLGRRTAGVLKTRHLRMQLGRSALLLGASLLYFTGFTLLPLAESAAMINVTPILVTILSAIILRETVGIRRWSSVFVGFTGAMIVIRPGMDSFTSAALYPLGAALAYGLYQVATRHVSHADSPMTSTTYTALVGTIVGSCVVPFFWTMPDIASWGLMMSLGLSGALGHYFMIRAYTVTEASVAAPYTYAVIIWMIATGYIFFGDVPQVWTIVGAVVIAASGLYIARRENIKSDRTPR